MSNLYDLHVMGDIGRWEISKGMVSYIASKCKDRRMNVLVSSMGGSTTEAMAISALFRQHGNVSVHFIGASASAATIISMGARHVSMDKDAVYLVHKCSCLVNTLDYFNTDQLQIQIEALRKEQKNMEALDSAVAGMYASRCKKSKEELLALMAKDTWITAKEALEWGFVDEITSYGEDEGTSGKISGLSAEYLSKTGIPMPPGYRNRVSLLDRIKSLLKEEDEEADDRHESGEAQEFKNISALAGTDITPKGGRCSLDIQGLTNIEEALSGLLHSAETLKEKEQGLREAQSRADSLSKDLEKARSEIAGLQSRLKDMAGKPAEQQDTAIVESGTSKKDAKPYRSVQKNARFLLSLVS